MTTEDVHSSETGGRRPFAWGILPTALCLLALWGFWSGFRIARIRSLPNYNPRSDVGLFYSEGDVRYRYYRMFADPAVRRGELWRVMGRDTRLQYPEGVRPLREFTIGIEPFYGILRRYLAPSVPAHVFLVDAVAVYTGLSMLMVFLLTRQATGANGWGLLAAALYCTLVPSYQRTTGPGFLPEDFALPFVLAAGALLLPFGRPHRPATGLLLGVAGGVAAGLASAFWHASQYPVALLAMALSLTAALTARRPRRFHLVLAATISYAALALLVPVLRAKLFIVSLPAAAFWHWTLWSWWPESRPSGTRRRIAAWGASLALLILLLGCLNPQGRSYSHVFEYVRARLLHPIGPPADPSGMSFAARMYWESPFLPPSLSQLVRGLRFALVLLPFALVPGWRFRKAQGASIALCGQALVLLVWGLLMRRFLVLAAPYLAAASICGVALVHGSGIPRTVLPGEDRHRGRTLVAALAVFAVVLNLVTIPPRSTRSMPASQAVISAVIDQARQNTGPDDAFFARLAWSSMLLAHCDRPVVVHPMWESAGSRHKYEALMSALFADEETFWRMLRKTHASYVLFDIAFAQGVAPGSARFKAGRTGPMEPDWTITRCQFAPEMLNHLDLVWQDLNCRIFRVRDEPAAGDAQRRRRIRQIVQDSFNPLFDSRNFQKRGDGYVCALATHARVMQSMELAVRAVEVGRLGDVRKHAELLQQALRLCPNNFDAHYVLALLHLSMGRNDLARLHAAEARRIAPLNRHLKTLEARITGAPATP